MARLPLGPSLERDAPAKRLEFGRQAQCLLFVEAVILEKGNLRAERHLKEKGGQGIPGEHGRTPSLAPAYDYVSTIFSMPDDDMGMNLAGTKRFSDVGDDLLARFAGHLRLPRKPVLDAAHEMVDRMRELWPQIRGGSLLMNEQRDLLAAHMETIPLFGPRTAQARR